MNNESVVLRAAFALGTNDVEVLVELYVDLVSVLGHLDLVLALLASDEARYASGQLWVLDGRLTAQVEQMKL